MAEQRKILAGSPASGRYSTDCLMPDSALVSVELLVGSEDGQKGEKCSQDEAEEDTEDKILCRVTFTYPNLTRSRQYCSWLIKILSIQSQCSCPKMNLCFLIL